MRKEEVLVIDNTDLIEPNTGYSWFNMKDSVAKEAATCDILIFHGFVVKDRCGVTKRITPKSARSLKGHAFLLRKKRDALNCPLDFFVSFLLHRFIFLNKHAFWK